MSGKKKKIMVFRFSAMGDVAMTVPVLQVLVKQNPGVEILMVSRPFLAPLFQDLPGVRFIGVDFNRYKGVFGLYKLYRELKKHKPDAVADLHDVIRSKILNFFFRLFGHKVVVIDKGRREKKELTRFPNKIIKPLKTTHERYADVFRILGLTVDLEQFKPLKANLSADVALFLQTFDKSPLIGIAPFAAHTGKQYPLKKIKEVISIILDKNKEAVILLLGGGKKEKELLDTLEPENRNRVFNITGLFSLDKELEIISRFSVLLSMDSGNAHLAALFGVPVVSVWGATHPYAGFAPLHQTEAQQLLPDLQQFSQLPTSIYGNKIFENFDKVWDTIAPERIADTVLQFSLFHNIV